MRRATTARGQGAADSHSTPLQGVCPSGRLDVLASRMIERYVSVSGSPLLWDLYRIGRRPLDIELHRLLGPRALPRPVRKVCRLIEQGRFPVPVIGAGGGVR